MPRRRGIDPGALARIRDDLNKGINEMQPEAPEDASTFVRPSYIASGEDLSTYTVGRADQYYQGPQLSTRVAAHKFIPVDSDGVPFAKKGLDPYSTASYRKSDASYGSTRISEMEHGPDGYVMVKWQKSGSRGDLSVYGVNQLVPLSVYRVFRDYYSKGRAVVHLLEPYGHEYATSFKYQDMWSTDWDRVGDWVL